MARTITKPTRPKSGAPPQAWTKYQKDAARYKAATKPKGRHSPAARANAKLKTELDLKELDRGIAKKKKDKAPGVPVRTTKPIAKPAASKRPLKQKPEPRPAPRGPATAPRGERPARPPTSRELTRDYAEPGLTQRPARPVAPDVPRFSEGLHAPTGRTALEVVETIQPSQRVTKDRPAHVPGPLPSSYDERERTRLAGDVVAGHERTLQELKQATIGEVTPGEVLASPQHLPSILKSSDENQKAAIGNALSYKWGQLPPEQRTEIVGKYFDENVADARLYQDMDPEEFQQARNAFVVEAADALGQQSRTWTEDLALSAGKTVVGTGVMAARIYDMVYPSLTEEGLIFDKPLARTVIEGGKEITEGAELAPWTVPSKEQQEDQLRRTVTSGVESMGPALMTMTTGPLGPIAGGVTSGFMYGLSSYSETYDAAIEQGLDPEAAGDVALQTALIEGVPGALSNALFFKMFSGAGPAVAGGARQAFINSAQKIGFEATQEAVEEGFQGYAQATAQNRAGMRAGDPLVQMYEGALAGAFMGAAFGGAGIAGESAQRSQLRQALGETLMDPNAPAEQRRAAAEQLAETIGARDPEVAKDALAYANDMIEQGLPVLSEQMMADAAEAVTPPPRITDTHRESVISDVMNDPTEAVPRVLQDMATDPTLAPDMEGALEEAVDAMLDADNVLGAVNVAAQMESANPEVGARLNNQIAELNAERLGLNPEVEVDPEDRLRPMDVMDSIAQFGLHGTDLGRKLELTALMRKEQIMHENARYQGREPDSDLATQLGNQIDLLHDRVQRDAQERAAARDAEREAEIQEAVSFKKDDIDQLLSPEERQLEPYIQNILHKERAAGTPENEVQEAVEDARAEREAMAAGAGELGAMQDQAAAGVAPEAGEVAPGVEGPTVDPTDTQIQAWEEIKTTQAAAMERAGYPREEIDAVVESIPMPPSSREGVTEEGVDTFAIDDLQAPQPILQDEVIELVDEVVDPEEVDLAPEEADLVVENIVGQNYQEAVNDITGEEAPGIITPNMTARTDPNSVVKNAEFRQEFGEGRVPLPARFTNTLQRNDFMGEFGAIKITEIDRAAQTMLDMGIPFVFQRSVIENSEFLDDYTHVGAAVVGPTFNGGVGALVNIEKSADGKLVMTALWPNANMKNVQPVMQSIADDLHTHVTDGTVPNKLAVVTGMADVNPAVADPMSEAVEISQDRMSESFESFELNDRLNNRFYEELDAEGLPRRLEQEVSHDEAREIFARQFGPAGRIDRDRHGKGAGGAAPGPGGQKAGAQKLPPAQGPGGVGGPAGPGQAGAPAQVDKTVLVAPDKTVVVDPAKKDPGDDPKFARGEPITGGMAAPALQKFADSASKKLKNLPTISALSNFSAAPAADLQAMQDAVASDLATQVEGWADLSQADQFLQITDELNRVKGVTIGDRVLLFADRIADERDAQITYFHETFGHFGIEKFLGKQGKVFFKNIGAMKGMNAQAAREWFAETFAEADGRGELETMDGWRGHWDNFTNMVRRNLRRVFPRLKISNAEIADLYRRSKEFVESGQAPVDATVGTDVPGIAAEAARPDWMVAPPTGQKRLQRVKEHKDEHLKMLKDPGIDERTYAAVRMRLHDFDEVIAKIEGRPFDRNDVNPYYDSFAPKERARLAETGEVVEDVGYQKSDEPRFAKDDQPAAAQPGSPGDYWSRAKAAVDAKYQRFMTEVVSEFQPVLELERGLAGREPEKFMEPGGQSRLEAKEEISPFLQIKLFPGLTEDAIEQIERRFNEPFHEKMNETDIKFPELKNYLIAQHAEQRNAVIADRNPYFDAHGDKPGSGMTNDEAAAIIAKAKESGKFADLEALSQFVYDMQEEKMRILVDAGIMTQDRVDELKERFGDRYVPLKGIEEINEHRARTGKGFSDAAKVFDVAKGRETVASNDPAYQTMIDLQEAVRKAEVAKVGQKMLKLARELPDPAVWSVNKGTPVRTINPNSGEVEVKWQSPALRKDDDPLVVAVYEKGEVNYIKFTPEYAAVADAMKKVGSAKELGRILNAVGSVTRFLSQMATSRNPTFPPVNFIKDVIGGSYNAFVHHDTKMVGKRIAALGTGLKGTYQTTRRGKVGGPKKAAPKRRKALAVDAPLPTTATGWVDEYQQAGGKVSFWGIKNFEDFIKTQQSKFKSAERGNPRKVVDALKGMVEFVEDANEIMEMTGRVAHYKAMRQSGWSPARSAVGARDATVDFNQRGAIGPALNALYMFANAGIQGNAVLMKTLRANKGKAAAAGVGASGFGWALMMRGIMGIDDEDGEHWWDKIEPHVKENNLVIPHALFNVVLPESKELREDMRDNHKPYYTIPLPYGYSIFYNMGQSLADYATGQKSAGQVGMDGLNQVFSNFSPLGQAKSESLPKTALKQISPSALQPFTEIGLNEKWHGGPLRPEQPQFGKKKPRSQLSFRHVSRHAKRLTDSMAEISGVTVRPGELHQGEIDMSPEDLEHLWDFMTSGPGKFVSRTLSAVDDFSKSEKGTIAGRLDDVDWTRVPLLRRFYGEIPDNYARNRYYDERDEVSYATDEGLFKINRDLPDWSVEQKSLEGSKKVWIISGPDGPITAAPTASDAILYVLARDDSLVGELNLPAIKGELLMKDADDKIKYLRENKKEWRIEHDAEVGLAETEAEGEELERVWMLVEDSIDAEIKGIQNTYHKREGEYLDAKVERIDDPPLSEVGPHQHSTQDLLYGEGLNSYHHPLALTADERQDLIEEKREWMETVEGAKKKKELLRDIEKIKKGDWRPNVQLRQMKEPLPTVDELKEMGVDVIGRGGSAGFPGAPWSTYEHPHNYAIKHPGYEVIEVRYEGVDQNNLGETTFGFVAVKKSKGRGK